MTAARQTVFTLLCLTIAGASAQSNTPPTVIQTETRVVLVDAVVTGKKGEYLHDLTAKDFHIWQDGKEQTITSLSLEAKSPSPDPHFLVLFFDDTRMTAQDQFLARQAAARFIDANSAPSHLIALVTYNGFLRVAQNFTDNAGRLKDALNRTESSSRVTATSKLERPQASGASGTDNFSSRNMLQAVANLTRGLGVLPGRKSLVLLTGGLPASSDLKTVVASAIEESSRSGVAIYPINVRPVSVDVDASSPNIQTRPTLGRRGGGPQGADDSPRNADSSADNPQFLLALASGTGGFVIRDSSDLLPGLQQIGEEQTDYYVLSYTPPESPSESPSKSKEGACHQLRVKVDRSGATVRARSSYCAMKPLDLIAGTPAAKNLETRAADSNAGNLKASMQLPYFYLSPEVATVRVAIEIAPGALKFENQKGKLHSEINLLGIANTADGGTGARFSDTLKLDYDSQADLDKIKDTTVHYEEQFKIAPGMYTFVLALGAGDANFGKLEAPLNVEPWNTGELALSSIVLSRETHPAADLGLISSLVEDRKPLIAGGTQYVPFGSNQFAKSDSGFFYLEAYDPNPALLRVRVRVLDRKTAEPKWDSGVTALPAPPSASRRWIPAGTSLKLNSLGPGAYQLEITASGSTGKEIKRTADFDVK